jgi:hypothetical protein
MAFHVRSRVNCPERVVISSDDDNSNVSQTGFSQFTCNLPTPVLDPQRCQVIRTSIPNIQLQIPDYQLVFWYYSLATATTVPAAADLRAIRLFPSYYQKPTSVITYTPQNNRYFTGPADFVTALNVAAAASGDSATNNPYWVSGDITFTFNTTLNQITFTGNTSGRFYVPAGYNDALVQAAIARLDITCPTYPAAASTFVQPQLFQYTLNLRVGYAMSGNSRGDQSFTNGSTVYANKVNIPIAQGTAVPVDSFPCLVYTNVVYLYTNFSQGSSLTSNNRHNLLCAVPITAGPLSINSYVPSTEALMTKLSQTIASITIEMRDSADQPYLLPDSATVDVEVFFGYDTPNNKRM